MEEGRRLAYLSSLGVSSWSPRFILPHAKASEAITFEEEPKTGEAAGISIDAGEPVKQLLEKVSVADIVSESISKKEEAKTEDNSIAQADVDAAGSKGNKNVEQIEKAKGKYPAQFALSAVAIDKGGLVVVDADAANSTLLQKQHMNLLSSILHVLGVSGKSFSKPMDFRWPLPGLDIEAEGDIAFEAVSAFFEKNIESREITWVLVLGDISTSVLEYLSEDILNQVLHIKGPSIGEMFLSTQAKKIMWQNISSAMPSFSALKA